MDTHRTTRSEPGLEHVAIPDAVAIVTIEPTQTQRLRDVSLHLADVDFAVECLRRVAPAGDESDIASEAMWRSAIIHLFKCFGTGVRFRLQPDEVLAGEPPVAKEVFEYFKELRDKHLAHDVSGYSQGVPAAALNDGTKSYKVEKIICAAAIAVTRQPDAIRNAMLLAQAAQRWLTRQFDAECERLTTVLEVEEYSVLIARPEATLPSLPPTAWKKPRR